MNGVPPIDWEGSLETFRSIRAPQDILQDQIPNHQEFWPTIYALLLEGKLDEAWQILSLHSDLAEVITSDRRSDSQERDILEAIYDVMTTHPFINIVNTLSSNSIDSEHVEISSSLSIEFKDWQDKVSSILQSSSSLLGRVSELNTVLQLLVGDKETLIAHSKGEWTTLSAGLFLYVYPPPLIRADISKIIESAMNMMAPRNDISEADRIRCVRYFSCCINITCQSVCCIWYLFHLCLVKISNLLNTVLFYSHNKIRICQLLIVKN